MAERLRHSRARTAPILSAQLCRDCADGRKHASPLPLPPPPTPLLGPSADARPTADAPRTDSAPTAGAACERALALNPADLAALNNLGNLLHARRRFPEAEATFRRALALEPRLAELHNNLGNVLQAVRNHGAAVAAYRQAIALRENFPEAHNNLGNVLKAQNQLAAAADSYRRALALNPRYAEAHTNLGNTLLALGRAPAALAAYRRSQQLQPAKGDAYFYESLALLLGGDLAVGFALYEQRWRSELKGARRSFAQPLWLGRTPLAGQTLLLHAEQGLGDTLQFVRYAALAAAAGARVILEVQPPLKPLLAGSPGVSAVVAAGEPLPPFDLHCPLLSLPHAFATTLSTIPAPVPYLAAPAGQTAHWRERLGPPTGPRIGLVWSGNRQHLNDRNRSVPLAVFQAAIASVPGKFFSLQKEYRDADERAAATALGLVDLSAEITDLCDTAAIIGQLDLVISVDTAVAHLAGALGKPVWVLLPAAPDWRWLTGRTDSPWYPTLRLFRQEQPGDWSAPVQHVRAALAQMFSPVGEAR